jgi:hypothetical protein
MDSGYEYDLFISYRRRDPVLGWMKNHFLPQLQQWLPQCVAEEPRIFIDFGLETGTDWPLSLQRALKRSKCLLPILTPEYFRSSWCRSEWESMIERERQLELRTESNPLTLIYPVRFFDGEHFPPEAQQMQWYDLSAWNYPVLSFAQTESFLHFIVAMQNLARELARITLAAPEWQPGWPTIPLKPPQEIRMGLPKIR